MLAGLKSKKYFENYMCLFYCHFTNKMNKCEAILKFKW